VRISIPVAVRLLELHDRPPLDACTYFGLDNGKDDAGVMDRAYFPPLQCMMTALHFPRRRATALVTLPGHHLFHAPGECRNVSGKQYVVTGLHMGFLSAFSHGKRDIPCLTRRERPAPARPQGAALCFSGHVCEAYRRRRYDEVKKKMSCTMNPSHNIPLTALPLCPLHTSNMGRRLVHLHARKLCRL
jgi:hypothetical protein